VNKLFQKKGPLLPVIAELVSGTVLGNAIFTIFLTLKLTNVIDWAYWWIFTPLWLVFFTLLILTQSKRLTKHVPLIARLVWLICIVSIVAFLVLLSMRLEHEGDPPFQLIFIPLWVLFGSSLLLGLSGIFVALCSTTDESKRQKYLLAGLAMLGFDAVFFPSVLMLALKLTEHKDYSWSVVFIPLWITDGVFLLTAFVLLLFTIGSRDSAVFSLSQVIIFLFVLPSAALFKALLVLSLDSTITMSWFWTMTPLLVVELLVFSCGLNIRFSKKQSQLPS